MILKSIRWRLQIWYGLVFLAVLTGFGLTAYELERNRQFRNLDAEFQKRMGALSSSMRPPLGPRGPGPDRGGGPDDQFPGGGPADDRGGGPGDGFPGARPPEDRPFPGPGGQDFQFHLPSSLTNLFGAESNSFYYVIWGRNGDELARSEAAPRDVPPPPITMLDIDPVSTMVSPFPVTSTLLPGSCAIIDLRKLSKSVVSGVTSTS